MEVAPLKADVGSSFPYESDFAAIAGADKRVAYASGDAPAVEFAP